MDNIFPPCSRILALEVMFDGISEHTSLSFASFWGILLASDDHFFRSIDLIDIVNDRIQFAIFLYFLCIFVKNTGGTCVLFFCLFLMSTATVLLS